MTMRYSVADCACVLEWCFMSCPATVESPESGGQTGIELDRQSRIDRFGTCGFERSTVLGNAKADRQAFCAQFAGCILFDPDEIAAQLDEPDGCAIDLTQCQ